MFEGGESKLQKGNGKSPCDGTLYLDCDGGNTTLDT